MPVSERKYYEVGSGQLCGNRYRKLHIYPDESYGPERDKIEADRAETQRMMQQLLQLKAQMAQNGGETPKKDETPSDTTTV